MRATVFLLFLAGAGFFALPASSARVEVSRVPLTRHALRELENEEGRMEHPHTPLTARDLHPATPILLAHVDESIPALIVIREREMTLAELEEVAQREHEAAIQAAIQAEREEIDDADDETRTAATTEEDDDDDALIESEFEISAPYGGYGGGYGSFGYGGGYGGGKKGGYGGGYKKVPYKKVPYKKVPIKKGPPKKLPPKKKGPPKKGGFGGYGGFGYGGGYGGFGKKY